MPKYTLNKPYVTGHQLTEFDMTRTEDHPYGSVKGISLRPADRELEVNTINGEERAKVGDFVLRVGTTGPKGKGSFVYLVVPPALFSRIFTAVQ